MSTIAGEVSNPQVIPKGTLITIPLIMAVYLFPTVAGLGSLGQWENWGTEADTVGYATVVETFWGPAFGVFFVVVAILAQCSIFNTYIASGSRGFFSLADDYLAPPVLVKCDKKHGVPYIAVLTVAISTMILCMLPFGFGIHTGCTYADRVLCAGIHFRYRAQKEDTGRGIQSSDPWRLWLPCSPLYSAYLRSAVRDIHQWFRLAIWEE